MHWFKSSPRSRSRIPYGFPADVVANEGQRLIPESGPVRAETYV